MAKDGISDHQRHVIRLLDEAVFDLPDRPLGARGTELRRVLDEVENFLRHKDEPISSEFFNSWDAFKTELIQPQSNLFRDEIRHEIGRHNMDKFQRMDEYIENRFEGSQSPELDLEEDDDVVFLLGAGASAASGIPTVNGLLDELLKQAQRTQMENLEPLISFCKGRDDVDIEDVLTAAYLSDFAVSERHVVHLLHHFLFSDSDEISEDTPSADVTSVNFIQNTLQTLFGLLSSTMIPKDPNPTHEAIQEFVSAHSETSIVTTNYDYCMDEQLLSNNRKIQYFIDEGEGSSVDTDSVDLIKMHGSINWWYCESCQSVGQVKPETAKRSSEDDSMDYPVIGVCPHCGGQRRPLLVPPISFKFVMFPPLIRIWDKGKQMIENADHIIAVGYSFSDSDAYIYKLVSKSLTEGSDTELVIVNPDRSVTSRLKERFTAELDDFDPEDQIKGFHSESQDVLPKLIESMLDYQVDEVPDSSSEDDEAAADD